MVNPKLKIVKKIWYDIDAPSSFGNQKIGKIFLAEPELAVGRKLTVSYANLSGDPQKQNINLKFKITKTQNNVLKTEVLGLELQSSSLKRLVRRDKTKVEGSFLAKTKDNFDIRVKPLLVTRFKASGGISNSLIVKVKEFLLSELNKKKFEEIIKELLNRQFQKTISAALKNIYPLSVAELRSIHIVKAKKEEEVEELKQAEVPAAEA